MSLERRLRAEVHTFAPDTFQASFEIMTSSSGRYGSAVGSAPTTKFFPSEPEARQWIKDQAAALGIEDIEWRLATISGQV